MMSEKIKNEKKRKRDKQTVKSTKKNRISILENI